MGAGLITALVKRLYIVGAFAVEAIVSGLEPIVYWDDGLSILLIIALAMLLARLWIAGPVALRDHSLGLRASWQITGDNFWRSSAYAALLATFGRGVWELVGVAGGATSIAEFSARDIFETNVLLHLVVIAIVEAFVWTFSTAAAVFALARLTDGVSPERPAA